MIEPTKCGQKGRERTDKLMTKSHVTHRPKRLGEGVSGGDGMVNRPHFVQECANTYSDIQETNQIKVDVSRPNQI